MNCFPLLLAAGDSGISVLVTFLIYILGVFFIAWASNRLSVSYTHLTLPTTPYV